MCQIETDQDLPTREILLVQNLFVPLKHMEKNYLGAHINSHHDCQKCSKYIFGKNSKRGLASNFKVHDAKSLVYECPACNKSFFLNDSVTSHQKNNCAGFPTKLIQCPIKSRKIKKQQGIKTE